MPTLTEDDEDSHDHSAGATGHLGRTDTREQYDELVQLSGRSAKSYLDQQIGTPEWQAMSDDERVEFVKHAMEEFREAGRDALKERYPELMGGDDEMPPLPPGFEIAR